MQWRLTAVAVQPPVDGRAMANEQLGGPSIRFRMAERWSEAAEFGLVAEQKPEDSVAWLHVAPVLILAGDDAGYPAYYIGLSDWSNSLRQSVGKLRSVDVIAAHSQL